MGRYLIGVTAPDGTYRQYALTDSIRLRTPGLYIGSDPSADISIPGAELWHAHVHHSDWLEVIAGEIHHESSRLRTGASTRHRYLPFEIARHRVELQPLPRDGELDHVIAPRSDEPQPLSDAAKMLRLRIETAGVREVIELGPITRLEAGITFGSASDNVVVIASAAPHALHLQMDHGILFGRALADDVAVVKYGSNYQPFEIGDATVQLCRWPRLDERVRVL